MKNRADGTVGRGGASTVATERSGTGPSNGVAGSYPRRAAAAGTKRNQRRATGVLLTAQETQDHLGVGHSYFYSVLKHDAGFPLPVLMPAYEGAEQLERWRLTDLEDWVASLKPREQAG